jgi:hypothetical protein
MAVSSGATIGTLVVRAPGLDAAGARRLAQAVGHALADQLADRHSSRQAITALRLRVGLTGSVSGAELAVMVARRISEALE